MTTLNMLFCKIDRFPSKRNNAPGHNESPKIFSFSGWYFISDLTARFKAIWYRDSNLKLMSSFLGTVLDDILEEAPEIIGYSGLLMSNPSNFNPCLAYLA